MNDLRNGCDRRHRLREIVVSTARQSLSPRLLDNYMHLAETSFIYLEMRMAEVLTNDDALVRGFGDNVTLNVVETEFHPIGLLVS